MPRKTLRVQVELDVQAVSCPGVWLCPNGKVSLQMFMLDSCIKTSGFQPVFPLLYHEKFIFYKNFHNAYRLSELQRSINKEYLYAELVQWQNGSDNGNVIASFQTSLSDVLYPSSYEGAVAGVDVDLLMEPSKSFPGIIAPKIEISTRTTVEEIICSNNIKQSNSYVVNPKTVTSEQCSYEPRQSKRHQEKVCHTVGYHKSRKCSKVRRHTKPPFVFRKAEDELLSRKPGVSSSSTKQCQYCLYSQGSNVLFDDKECVSPITSRRPKAIQQMKEKSTSPHGCCKRSKVRGKGHAQKSCPVCSEYNIYFEENPRGCATPKMEKVYPSCRDSFVRRVTTSSPVRDYSKFSARSPVKTVGREYHQQPRNVWGAAYPSSRTTTDSSDIKLYDNAPVVCNKYNQKTGYYSLVKKPSLAEQIHRRLQRTLDYEPIYQPQCPCEENGIETLCSCPKFGNCREGFYKNLGKFYRNLRRC